MRNKARVSTLTASVEHRTEDSGQYKARKKNESHTYWKGRNKTVFIHMIAYVEYPLDYPKN